MRVFGFRVCQFRVGSLEGLGCKASGSARFLFRAQEIRFGLYEG